MAATGHRLILYYMDNNNIREKILYINAPGNAVDEDYFLKSVGLRDAQPSARNALPLSLKKPESSTKHLEIEEMPEHLFEDNQCKTSGLPGYRSPACRSPQSPKAPYMNWEDDDDDFSDLTMTESPPRST